MQQQQFFGVSPDEVKKQLETIVLVAEKILFFVPMNNYLARVIQLLLGLTKEDWFVGFVTYIINRFDSAPSKEDFAVALQDYVKES